MCQRIGRGMAFSQFASVKENTAKKASLQQNNRFFINQEKESCFS